jgi:hypothetical protein
MVLRIPQQDANARTSHGKYKQQQQEEEIMISTEF